MKRFMNWLFAISIVVFFVDWTAVGVKLLGGDYDITAGAYVGLVCCVIMMICIICRIAGNQCPHCGKLVQQPRAKYCPHCGQKLED